MRCESWARDGEAVVVVSFPSKGSEDVATLSDDGFSGVASNGCAVSNSWDGVCLRRPPACDGEAERRLEEGLPLDADIMVAYVRAKSPYEKWKAMLTAYEGRGNAMAVDARGRHSAAQPTRLAAIKHVNRF